MTFDKLKQDFQIYSLTQDFRVIQRLELKLQEYEIGKEPNASLP